MFVPNIPIRLSKKDILHLEKWVPNHRLATWYSIPHDRRVGAYTTRSRFPLVENPQGQGFLDTAILSCGSVICSGVVYDSHCMYLPELHVVAFLLQMNETPGLVCPKQGPEASVAAMTCAARGPSRWRQVGEPRDQAVALRIPESGRFQLRRQPIYASIAFAPFSSLNVKHE